MLPNLIYLLLAFAMLVWMANFVRRTIGFLHLLQLEGYKSARFWKWAFRDPKQLFDISAAKLGIALFVFGAIAYILRMEIWGIWIFLAAWIATGAYLLLTRKKAKAKKPLVFTPRAVRLLSMSLILMGLGIASIFWLSFSLPTLLAFFVGIHLLIQLAAVNIGLANILLYPLESLINWGYLSAAKRKISRCGRLKVIALPEVTGRPAQSTSWAACFLGNTMCWQLRRVIIRQWVSVRSSGAN